MRKMKGHRRSDQLIENPKFFDHLKVRLLVTRKFEKGTLKFGAGKENFVFTDLPFCKIDDSQSSAGMFLSA